jgi:pimeloyl-[acyl-carrier protein] synthase
LNMDGADHQRQRRLMMRAFSKPVVESLRPEIIRYIEESLEEAGRIGEPFDFVSQIARIIPARMILKQLALPDTLISKLHHWSITLNQIGNIHIPAETAEEINTVLLEMQAIFEPEFEKRRAAPNGDFISELVHANEGDDRLSSEEMFGICVITLIAGHDTTANTMALGTAMLAGDRPAAAGFRKNTARIPDMIMELQRKVAMSTMMGRIVSEDFEWKGHALKKGQVVLLAQGAANRDPNVFPNPEQFDSGRPQVGNLTFAPGPHHCIGFMLAKAVLSEFFPRLFKRFDVEVLDPLLDFAPTAGFRGLNTLRVSMREREPVNAGMEA